MLLLSTPSVLTCSTGSSEPRPFEFLFTAHILWPRYNSLSYGGTAYHHGRSAATTSSSVFFASPEASRCWA